MFRYTRPSRLRIEASSACNLRCPSCPTTTGHVHPAIGTGLLMHDDFGRSSTTTPGSMKSNCPTTVRCFSTPPSSKS